MKTSHCTNDKRIALFPGSFDPFTRGHESIVTRALPLFDEIIIAIGVNINKQALTSMELRKQLIESVFKNEPKVKVITYTGLTANVAREHNANFFLRGVRLIQDFENANSQASKPCFSTPCPSTATSAPALCANLSSTSVMLLPTCPRTLTGASCLKNGSSRTTNNSITKQQLTKI